MSVKKSHYEASLAEYKSFSCDRLTEAAPTLPRDGSQSAPTRRKLNHHPLPIVWLRHTASADKERGIVTTAAAATSSALRCRNFNVRSRVEDQDWVEILSLFIVPKKTFRPAAALRQTQVLLDKDYEWLMPPWYKHILSDGLTPSILCSLSLPRHQNESSGACTVLISHLLLKYLT